MKIGLLSDTHQYLHPAIFIHFEHCDEIWHAGDIGSEAVANQLEAFKPLRAVYGNIDHGALQQRFPLNASFRCEEKKILITHIANSPPYYNTRVKKLIRELAPDILVCGHSHILKVIPDKINNLLYLNPGAAGKHGFHQVMTLLRFEIHTTEIRNMEIIELGKRGALPS